MHFLLSALSSICQCQCVADNQIMGANLNIINKYLLYFKLAQHSPLLSFPRGALSDGIITSCHLQSHELVFSTGETNNSHHCFQQECWVKEFDSYQPYQFILEVSNSLRLFFVLFSLSLSLSDIQTKVQSFPRSRKFLKYLLLIEITLMVTMTQMLRRRMRRSRVIVKVWSLSAGGGAGGGYYWRG